MVGMVIPIPTILVPNKRWSNFKILIYIVNYEPCRSYGALNLEQPFSVDFRVKFVF